MKSLSGEELSAIGFILGISLSSGRSPEELNNLGNVLNVTANVILTIASRRAELQEREPSSQQDSASQESSSH